MRNQVILFKSFSAELGDPSKLLFVAKLANPPSFDGIRIRISIIKKLLNNTQIKFNITSIILSY